MLLEDSHIGRIAAYWSRETERRFRNQKVMKMNRTLQLVGIMGIVAAVGLPARGGYVDGMSLYEYVGSSPVQYRDPSGLKIDHYDCCSEAQKKAIKAAHDAAEKKLPIIKRAIDKYTYDWVLVNYVLKNNREMGVPKHDEQTVWTSYRRDMRVNITKMQNKFNSGIGVECEKECDEGDRAYVRGLPLFGSFGDIHFCPLFFQLEHSQDQASNFLHELSHLAADTDDRCLNWYRKSGWFTTGGWYAKDAADDADWFGLLYRATDMYQAHETWIWRKIWPKAK